MNSRITVLDFGYIELIDAWGRLEPEAKPGDEAIIAAARMSTGKGFLGWGSSLHVWSHVRSPYRAL